MSDSFSVKDKLTEKQKTFIDHFMEHRNHVAAYRFATPNSTATDATAKANAYQILRLPKIKKYMETCLQINYRTQVSTGTAKLLDYCAKAIDFSPLDCFDDNGRLKPVEELIEHKRHIRKVKVTTKPDGTVITDVEAHSKDKALDLMAKHLKFDNTNKKGNIVIQQNTTSNQFVNMTAEQIRQKLNL